ncbi:hypothetical protein [Hahella sp. HN01]|uniref:hypothetical protein n=1 Tax=Hahella sp. HN01 TaxID=2847262 RepID=UPI001C1EAB99|nr:hypothetical protein [Hahella sp. HN01]MBU6951388.1 hypothetical protein [Hahella sp. HN01]
MNDTFSVDYFSDTKYNLLTAEISYGGQILCQINRDKGIEHVEIEFFHEQWLLDKPPAMKFPLDAFLSLVDEIRQELSELE